MVAVQARGGATTTGGLATSGRTAEVGLDGPAKTGDELGLAGGTTTECRRGGGTTTEGKCSGRPDGGIGGLCGRVPSGGLQAIGLGASASPEGAAGGWGDCATGGSEFTTMLECTGGHCTAAAGLKFTAVGAPEPTA